MELFFEPTLTFEKTSSAEAALPEDPNAWSNAILQELYKQVPYVADFDPQIVMSQVDGQRGYGFGHVQVGNKTELPPDAKKESLQASGVQEVRIPIIIRDSNLQPFDILIKGDGQVIPLTEGRLREALFRPQQFDMTSKSPGDTSLISQLYPPFRNNYGGGAGISVMTGGMGKDGQAKEANGFDDLFHEMKLRPKVNGNGKEKKASVLDAVLPLANTRDYNSFFSGFTPDLQAAYIKNAYAVGPSVQKIAKAEPVSFEKKAMVLPHLMAATVAQVAKAPPDVGGYFLKTATHKMWEPRVQVVDRGEVVHRFGEKIALATDTNGSVTMASDAEAQEPTEEGHEPELIKDFGIYKVRDEGGKDLVGYVFPNLIDLDGKQIPLALFTNGSQSALQGDIVGTRMGDALPMHEGHPRGHGCFFTLEGGEALATLPVTVGGSFTDENGAALFAETVDGQKVKISRQPNIQEMTMVDDTLLIPESYRWLSLEGAQEVALASTPEEYGGMKEAVASVATVMIRGDGTGGYSLDGMSLDKIASEERSFMSFDDALFLLGGLGVDLDHAQHKLAHASTGSRPVAVRIGRLVKTASEMNEEAVEAALKAPINFFSTYERNLMKEAAVIPDPVAVDTVLSLGFINPENMSSFVRSLPQVEEGQRRLCELLIASRLGLKEVPTTALERAIRAVEEVLEGLKILAFQKN